MPRIEIYTTATCPYCFAAKALLTARQRSFEEIPVYVPDNRARMIERANGRRTVPQIFIDGVHIGGYDDLAALERQGRLDAILSDTTTGD